MKTKKKRIAQEIQSRILTIVIAIFMVVAVVVAVMVGNVSLSAQKNDLEMQSKAASYQLEIFFQEYMTIVEQMAIDKDVRTLLTETKAGDKITESADYQTVFHDMEKIAAADSDNIQAVWLGDIDANVATQSDRAYLVSCSGDEQYDPDKCLCGGEYRKSDLKCSNSGL